MARRERVFRIVAVTILLLVTSLAAEGLLRVYFSRVETLGEAFRGFDPLTVQIEPHGQDGYRPRPNAKFHYRNGTIAHANAERFRGPDVRIPKPEGVFRIAIFGGSTTHGWGVADEETIDAWMRKLFTDRGFGEFEIVNLGFDGYDSWQCLQRWRSDGTRFDVDAVIVNAGVNDVRNAKYAELTPGDRRTVLWSTVLDRLRADNERGGPTLWSRIKHRSYLARFPGFVRHLKNMKETADPVSELSIHDDAETVFSMNLEALLAEVPSRVPVLLSTPPSRLKLTSGESAPGVSYWLGDAAETQAYRDRLAAVMARLAGERSEEMRPVQHLAVDLAADLFLDDCHLTTDGNRELAQAFVNWTLQLRGGSVESP
jgi:lysophospholipase L1-like esterase